MSEQDCIQGYYKHVNGKTYGPYAYKKRGHCKFTAKDITRIMTFARKEGLVTDSELLNAWGQATNNKSLICAIASLWQTLNMNWTALMILSFIKAILTIIKGFKILASGKKSKLVSTVLELIVPKKYWEELGIFLVCSGSIEAVLTALGYMFQTVIDNAIAAETVRAACAAEVFVMPVGYGNNKPGDFEDITVSINGFVHTLNTELPIIKEADKNFIDTYVVPFDLIDFETKLAMFPIDLLMLPIRSVWGDVQQEVRGLPDVTYDFSFWDVITGKKKIDPTPSILTPDENAPPTTQPIP